MLEVYDARPRGRGPVAFVLCHFSHAYVEGCSLYFSFVASDVNEAEMERRYDKVWRVALPAAIAAGANVTHHHGVGLLKQSQLLEELGEGRRMLRRAARRRSTPTG